MAGNVSSAGLLGDSVKATYCFFFFYVDGDKFDFNCFVFGEASSKALYIADIKSFLYAFES